MTEIAETTEKISQRTDEPGPGPEAAALGAPVGGLVPFTDALPVPPVLRPQSGDVLRETEIALSPTWVRLHAQLPPTLMWGYNGTVPGPTIEVRRGERIRIAWTNRIPKGSEYPVTAVEVGPVKQDEPHRTTAPDATASSRTRTSPRCPPGR